jgi:mannosyltransferase OCH1-like enzyme
MKNNNNIVHGLWIGSSLSAIELLCMKSFTEAGHTFYLWAYNKIDNLPERIQVKDANKIIPSNEIFTYTYSNKFGHGKGSYAGFSDIFRYKLLYEFGGWWTDMDITCLKPLVFEEEFVFRRNGQKGVVGNLMKCAPKSELMLYCYERAKQEVTAENKNWMLPISILNDGISKFKLNKNITEISNEDSWTLVSEYLIKDKIIPENWYVFHWMNEEWRRVSLSKNNFIKDSVIEKLLTKLTVKHGILNNEEIKKLHWNIGLWNYRIINIKARLKWYLNL